MENEISQTPPIYMVAKSADGDSKAARSWAWLAFTGIKLFRGALGLLALTAVWSLVSSSSEYLPGPLVTFRAAVELFADPFYVRNSNDVGIGWQLWASLQRVALGFGLAACIGIPVGFMIGRFPVLRDMAQPIISFLKPVSPLAWLPIGLAVFKAAHPSAIFVITITSVWPMIINTAFGVAAIPQDYLNVARVLKLSEFKVFTKILVPAALPFVVTGMKLSIGVAWLVIVAAEMLTGGVGIGFWIWDEWNNLNMAHIIIGIFVIGAIGLVLEVLLETLYRRVSSAERT